MTDLWDLNDAEIQKLIPLGDRDDSYLFLIFSFSLFFDVVVRSGNYTHDTHCDNAVGTIASL